MNNLTNCYTAIQTAQNNKIQDFQIDEDLKSKTRKFYTNPNPINILFLMLIAYVISLYSVLSFVIVLYISYYYIKKHPSWDMFKLYWINGATNNQLNVIYYQIFSHVPRLKYLLIIPIILLLISIWSYTPYFPKIFEIRYIILLDYVNFMQNINNDIVTIINQIQNKELADLIIYIWTFSDLRAVSAYCNSSIIGYFAIMSIIQIIKRPKNVR